MINEIAKVTGQIDSRHNTTRTKQFLKNIYFSRILDMVVESCPHTVKNFAGKGVRKIVKHLFLTTFFLKIGRQYKVLEKHSGHVHFPASVVRAASIATSTDGISSAFFTCALKINSLIVGLIDSSSYLCKTHLIRRRAKASRVSLTS